MGFDPFVIVCTVFVCIFFALHFAIKDSESFLALVPVNTFVANKYVWNIVTCNFYESQPIKVVFELLLLFQVTNNLSITSSDSFALYFLVTVLGSSFFTSSYCFIRFFATKMDDMIFDPLYGFSGVLICFIMFARQQRGNQSVFYAFPFITFHNLPILLWSLQMILYIAGFGKFTTDLPFTSISILLSWVFLRFYYKFDNKQVLGDDAEDFSFVAMFPSVKLIIELYSYSFTTYLIFLTYAFLLYL